jgi:hypothetical protein
MLGRLIGHAEQTPHEITDDDVAFWGSEVRRLGEEMAALVCQAVEGR